MRSSSASALLNATLAVALAGSAAAQNPPAATPKSTAQIDAGEPRAMTAPLLAAPAPAAAAAPATVAPAATVPPPVSGKSVTALQRPGSFPKEGGGKPTAADRLNLGTATVTGDREQPKVMYIVPWKSSNIGDLSGKPMNSLLDEALAPVDRDEFRREVAYFDAVKGDNAQTGPSSTAPKQVEK